jgi:signal transduction histidine kinase
MVEQRRRLSKSDALDSPLASGRVVLWIGCAFILAVICITTADVLYSLRKTSAKSDAVVSAFRERSHLLEALRGLMLRSARSPESDAERGMDASDLPSAHLRANQLLETFRASLEASGDEATQQRLRDLRFSIDRYWDALPAMRAWNGEHPRGTTQVAETPGRKQVRHIARQIMDLNREQQDRAEAQLRIEQERLQREIVIASALSLFAIVGLIAGISFRIRTVELYAKQQYRDVLQARDELKTFAGRLEDAQEEERRKLSRELHDEFGQTMAAALVELSRIQEGMTDEEETQAQLGRVKLDLESSMRSIRDVALMLRPSMLDDLGLVPALRWQAREVARRSGLEVRVEADDHGESLPDDYRTCIYRVVQEALHNVVKHASATRAVVNFRWSARELILMVEDDGKGFLPTREKGIGLLGMEERVGRLAGQLRVASAPGKGTAIRVILPIPENREAEVVS